MTQNRSILSLNNLDVRFPGLHKTVHAVRGVSLELKRGEIVAMVGESGSGKTITAMATLGLLPSSAQCFGSCDWLGECKSLDALQKQPPSQGAIVFQNPLTALNPFFTIEQQMSDIARRRRNLMDTVLRDVLLKSLNDVHMPDPEQALKKYPHQLSGGQIQRVVIATALICEPDVLIADEPTTALDVTVQAQILILLKELAELKGMAVLLITHDLGVVGTISDRVEVMYAGQIVESGLAEQVLTAPQHPYTKQLLQTVPRLDSYMEDSLDFIPGQVPDLSQNIIGCAFSGRCRNADPICRVHTPDLIATDSGRLRCSQPWLKMRKEVAQ